jgi:hypothetical protein
MEFIKAIRDLEITASGGFAVYVIMCVAYVTIVGLYQIGHSILEWFK